MSEIDALVDEKVKEKMDKQELDNKLNKILNSYEIYPEIIKSLSGLRKSVESLNKSILESNESHVDHYLDTKTNNEDLNAVFIKVRDIIDKMKALESELVDKNNSNSLIETMTRLIEGQNKGMTDLNNPSSIISILKKDNNAKGWITWLLLTALSITTLLKTFLPLS